MERVCTTFFKNIRIAVEVSNPNSAKIRSTSDLSSGSTFACTNAVAAMMIFPFKG